MQITLRTRFAALACMFACWGSAHALDTSRPEISRFVTEMVEEHGFKHRDVERVLAGAKTQQSIIEAISRPAERVRAWHEYRDIFITPKRIEAGVQFWNEHADELNRICKKTGVPIEILVGIIGVETYFGRITGKYRVIDALATLAFDYPPRSKFFRRELAEFLLLAREEDIELEKALGSYAGAMGSPQFIPSSYRAYAVDSDKNGQRDLWASWSDVIGSVANYFVVHGCKKDRPVVTQATLRSNYRGAIPTKNRLEIGSTVRDLTNDGVLFVADAKPSAGATLVHLEGASSDEQFVAYDNFYVITRYNRSVMYALAVWQLGQSISAKRSENEK